MSSDYKFRLNLIDPLANSTQCNTNRTTTDDLNDSFRILKSMEIGTGGYWQGWDTKGTRGQEEFKMRLMNALRVGRPFNNTIVDNGRTVKLPTIWVMDDCKLLIESLMNWRYEEHGTTRAELSKDDKEKPEQKWSHFPIAVECLLKDSAVYMAHYGSIDLKPQQEKLYFRRR
jgi:hypothetical protein